MPTRNVVLTEHHEAFIRRLVATGRYRNASEVMRDALRSLERQEEQAAAALGWLRGQIEPGLEQARRGELVDATLEEILDEIDRKLDTADERAARAGQPGSEFSSPRMHASSSKARWRGRGGAGAGGISSPSATGSRPG